MKVIGIIPARYGSTRFPGKPLALIAGKPLIRHVVERCQQAKSLTEVIVATDDTRIWEVVQSFCRAEMTAPDHPSGSDRIAEVAARCACDAVVNVQGDEPLIDPAVIDAVVGALVVTAMENYLAQFGAWVTVTQGVIFMLCVLFFRKGLVGTIGGWFKLAL